MGENLKEKEERECGEGWIYKNSRSREVKDNEEWEKGSGEKKEWKWTWNEEDG